MFKFLIGILLVVSLIGCDIPQKEEQIIGSEYLSEMWNDYVDESITQMAYYPVSNPTIKYYTAIRQLGDTNVIESVNNDNMDGATLEYSRIAFRVKDSVGINIIPKLFPIEYTELGEDITGYRTLMIDVSQIAKQGMNINYGDELLRIEFVNGTNTKEFILNL